MQNVLKDLQRRVARLEELLRPFQSRGLIWVNSLEPSERDGLAVHERIVLDSYQDASGQTVMTSERITSDPSDVGKCLADGSWDRKALDERLRFAPTGIQIRWAKARPNRDSLGFKDGSDQLSGVASDPIDHDTPTKPGLADRI